MSDDPSSVARRFADVLETRGLPYAIGGALALAYWGTPRATKDADINIFVDAARVAEVMEAMRHAGISFEAAAVRAAAQSGENAKGRAGSVVVDVFFNSIPLHDAAAARAVVRPLHGRPIRILSAEDLTLFKLLFFRGKDIVDIEVVVGVQGAALDRDYIRRWLVDLVGDDDVRVGKWDEICGALPI